MSFSQYGSASRSPPTNIVAPRPSSSNALTQEVLSGVPTPNDYLKGGDLNNLLFSSRPVERHHNKNLASYTRASVYHGTNRVGNVPISLSKAIPRSVRGGGHTATHGGGHTAEHGGDFVGGGHKMGHYGGDLVGGDAQSVSGTIKNVAGTIASFLPFIL